MYDEWNRHPSEDPEKSNETNNEKINETSNESTYETFRDKNNIEENNMKENNESISEGTETVNRSIQADDAEAGRGNAAEESAGSFSDHGTFSAASQDSADHRHSGADSINDPAGDGAGVFGMEQDPVPDRDNYRYAGSGADEAFGSGGSKDAGSRRYVREPGVGAATGRGNARREDPHHYERVYQEEPPRRSRGLLSTLAMVLIGAVLGSGITMASGRYLLGDNAILRTGDPVTGNSVVQKNTTPSPMVTAPPADTGVTAENNVASEVTPSVVGITTRTKVQQPLFFGEGGGSGYVDGVGSGVIVSADGYIVTNSHVVDNGDATNIQIVFSDETTAEGKVLWSDAALDLAIVKTDRTSLVPVEIGSSDAVRVGDKAIAIGNPLGLDLQSTLTSGYVSGLDRSITIQSGGTMSGLIQTDAAINEGNSGGALLNSAGQLIGINTAKAGGGASGIGFAIPIDTAKPIIEKVMTEGTFKSVYIGITGINVAAVKAQDDTLTFDGHHGVYVMEVMNGTAAAEAGLKSGDIITQIDDHAITGMTDLKKALLNYQVGDEVQVTYYRNNDKKTEPLTFAQDSSNIEQFFNQEAP